MTYALIVVCSLVMVALLFAGAYVYIRSSRRWFDELTRATRNEQPTATARRAERDIRAEGHATDVGAEDES